MRYTDLFTTIRANPPAIVIYFRGTSEIKTVATELQSLKIDKSSVRATSGQTDQRNASREGTTGGKSHILLVEDAAICREPVAYFLSNSGFKVTCAANGREALDAIQSSPPDLILLDLIMPDMDGLTVLRRPSSPEPAEQNPRFAPDRRVRQKTYYGSGQARRPRIYAENPIFARRSSGSRTPKPRSITVAAERFEPTRPTGAGRGIGADNIRIARFEDSRSQRGAGEILGCLHFVHARNMSRTRQKGPARKGAFRGRRPGDSTGDVLRQRCRPIG